MFNLESAMANWRQQMRAAGIRSAERLDELESHLREEVVNQMDKGEDEQQAFQKAVVYLGNAEALRNEFIKTGAANSMQLRRFAGFTAAGVYAIYAILAGWILLKSDLNRTELLAGFASVATLLLVMAAVWNIFPRFFPAHLSKPVQSAIGLVGGISGIGWLFAFSFLILPACNFTPDQLVVAVFWVMVPVMLLPTMAFMIIDKCEHTAAPAMSS